MLFKKQLRYLVLMTLLSLALWQYAARKAIELPEPTTMHPLLEYEPEQNVTDALNFFFEYMGSRYFVEPLADYEISGLVVSHNNIHSIGDAYHDSRSVDLKDLCVVWGSNSTTGVYRDLQFWSEPWTCFVKADSREVYSRFDGTQLSNNHLLGGSEKIREHIRNARIGDQVRFKGWLVSYAPADHLEWKRTSSLVRTDTGNGACEVVFVTDMEILKTANDTWRHLEWLAHLLFWIGLCATPLTFIYGTLQHSSKRQKELEHAIRNSRQGRLSKCPEEA